RHCCYRWDVRKEQLIARFLFETIFPSWELPEAQAFGNPFVQSIMIWTAPFCRREEDLFLFCRPIFFRKELTMSYLEAVSFAFTVMLAAGLIGMVTSRWTCHWLQVDERNFNFATFI